MTPSSPIVRDRTPPVTTPSGLGVSAGESIVKIEDGAAWIIDSAQRYGCIRVVPAGGVRRRDHGGHRRRRDQIGGSEDGQIACHRAAARIVGGHIHDRALVRTRIFHRERRRSAAIEVQRVVDAVVVDEEVGDLADGHPQAPALPVDREEKQRLVVL